MNMSIVAAVFAGPYAQRSLISAIPEIHAGPSGVRVPMDLHAVRAGRNDNCPCGSGKKFKKCCIDKKKTRSPG